MGISKNNSKENLEINDTSLNIKEENLKLLKNIFPNVFSEDKLDIEKLKNLLGESIIDEKTIEKYSLSWAGKSDAFKAIRTPSTGTLIKDNKGVHEDNTENIFIEGDNLEVLKLLQKHYYNKIKMIYIDPPYNTGKDFVYKDNFTESVESYYEMTGQTEGGVKMTANTEKNGRFHSDRLTMMYPRLFFARNLLKDDGVIFVSIDDNEVANLRLIMDEIFGEENFLGQIVWQTATDNNPSQIGVEHEYIVCYCKNILEQNEWEVESEKGFLIKERYEFLKKEYKDDIEKIQNELRKWLRLQNGLLSGVSHYSYVDEKGVYYPGNSSNTKPGGYQFDIIHPLTKKKCKKPDNGWRWPEKTFLEAQKIGDVWFGEDENSVPKIKKRLDTVFEKLKSYYYEDNRLSTSELKKMFENKKIFENPKSIKLIKHLLKFIVYSGDIVLDFFAGSGTTAHAVMELNAEDGGNRKWICVQLPELTDEKSEAYKAGYKTISEISRERIKRVVAKIELISLQNQIIKTKVAIKKDNLKDLMLTQVKKEKENLENLDLGFKSFSLTKSNFKKWNTMNDSNSIEEIMKQAKLLIDDPFDLCYELDTEKLEKIQEKVVCEIFLKEGFDLNSKIKKEGDIFVVIEKAEEKERKIFISFAKSVSEKDVEKLKLTDDDTFVCFDSALTDTIKVNIAREVNLKVM